MATLDIEIQDRIATVKFAFGIAQTRGEIIDGEAVRRTGIIQLGVIPVIRAAVSGQSTKWYAWATSSDFNYRTLINPPPSVATFVTRTATFVGDPSIPTGELPIEQYITAIGDMDGVESNGSTVEFAVYARKVPDATEVNKVRVEAYYRTSGGTETKFGEFTTPDLTGSFVQYTGSFAFTQSWATNSRFVMKCIGINLGDPE